MGDRAMIGGRVISASDLLSFLMNSEDCDSCGEDRMIVVM